MVRALVQSSAALADRPEKYSQPQPSVPTDEKRSSAAADICPLESAISRAFLPPQTRGWRARGRNICWLLPPADHLLIERDRGQFVPSRRRRMMANVRVERLLKIPAESSPELRIPALQLKREWSPWPQFGSDPGNPRELSKG
jgi:hypothetical protein